MEIIKSKRNQLLEAIRGAACILVVFCHFDIKGVIGTYIVAIARFAVPFFLILSGYYSYRKIPAFCGLQRSAMRWSTVAAR